ncbi:MAG: flagellar biosynthetic protein FliR [Myxococcota bacterium]|nr:flagellar biosynthetic protein FliR [Myxococcota bacterium]
MIAPEAWLGLLLASVRVVALLSVAPIFGHAAVPRRIRAGLALTVGVALSAALPAADLPSDPSPIWIGGAVAVEFAAGAALGFAARLILDAVSLCGGFVALQGGLGAADVVDPTSNASSAAVAVLFQAIAVLVYLGIDGHHALLRGLVRSFELMPPGGGALAAATFASIARLGAGFFEIAVRLAAPVTVAMLLANVATGLVGRAMPQMNLMVVQLPAHILMVLALLLAGAAQLTTSFAEEIGAWSLRAGSVLRAGP